MYIRSRSISLKQSLSLISFYRIRMFRLLALAACSAWCQRPSQGFGGRQQVSPAACLMPGYFSAMHTVAGPSSLTERVFKQIESKIYDSGDDFQISL